MTPDDQPPEQVDPELRIALRDARRAIACWAASKIRSLGLVLVLAFVSLQVVERLLERFGSDQAASFATALLVISIAIFILLPRSLGAIPANQRFKKLFLEFFTWIALALIVGWLISIRDDMLGASAAFSLSPPPSTTICLKRSTQKLLSC